MSGGTNIDWLAKLASLRPAKARRAEQGVAPHKPLLLLCLLDLANESVVPPTLTRTASLALRFRAYGSVVSERWPTRLDLRLPFFHLKTQGFWEAFDAERRKAQAPEHCVAVELDPSFHAALQDPDFRRNARLFLIREYFSPAEQLALLEAMGLDGRHVSAKQIEELVRTVRDAAKRRGRSVKFQVGVVDGYHHTCALTGYRCFTDSGATVVDAAHIESWAETQNDDLGNGLALSKTAHWMFDEGLWSVTHELRIVIRASRFTEAGPDGLCLANFANQPLRFAPSSRLRPSLDSLKKHRRKHGFES